MAELFNLFGIAWIPTAVILVVGIIDICMGSYLYYRFIDIFDLDGYPTLRDKYRDPNRYLFQNERYYAYAHYSRYLQEMLESRAFSSAQELRYAKRHYDYLTLYYLELAWSGNRMAQRWLDREPDEEYIEEFY